MDLRCPAPSSVLILLLSGVGDTLMFTPALRLLRLAWPRTRMVALTMRQSERDALDRSPDLDEVRFWPFLGRGRLESLRFVHELRGEGFDLSILPCPSNRLQYNLIARLVGARRRVAFRYLKQSRLNLDFLNTELLPHRDNVHNVEHNLRLAEALTGLQRDGVVGWDPHLVLHTDEQDRTAAARFLELEGLAGSPCVGFHLSSSRAKHMERKCWPKERFLELLDRLSAAHRDAGFLVFCGDEDLEETAWLSEKAGPRLRIAMKLPLRTAAEVIRRCAIFVTNDSGMLHVASSVRTPTVAIFGPTNPLRTGPWKAPAGVVRLGLPCSPCFYHTSHDLTCRAGIDFACVKELEVAPVQTAAEALLERGSG